MTYLGLGPDDEYDDDDLEPLREPAVERPRPVDRRPAASAVRPRAPEPEYDPDVAIVGSVRRLEPQPVEQPRSGQMAGTPGVGRTPGTRPSSPVVRPIPMSASVKPHVVSPTSFNHAQEIADKYKSNVPVIFNLQAVDRDLSRRLIDFASGLCYGLGGTMEKVAHQVYLLTPSNVEVSAEERRRLQERGFYD